MNAFACALLATAVNQSIASTTPVVSSPPSLTTEEPAEKPAAWQRQRLSWGALPAVSYNTDEGLGLGALLSLYRYDGRTRPYKWSTTFMIFATTKGIHSHEAKFDFIDVGGRPLRLDGRLQFRAATAANYCGVGGAVTCDVGEAQAYVDTLDLSADDAEEAEKHYYKLRHIQPNFYVNARWRLKDGPHKIEAFLGWRIYYALSGSLKEGGPYPHSLYTRDHSAGEEGLMSVVQAGVVADNRDFEPAPTKGYWVEASIRGANPGFGSNPDWAFVGFNTTLRGYMPFDRGGRLVLATRFVFDGTFGNMPVVEMAVPGGLQLYRLVGGMEGGRGLRDRRNIGRVKVLAQPELRARVLSFRALRKIPVDIGLLAFLDVGHVAVDWSDFGRTGLLVGEGAGLRLAFDSTFVVRFDVGFSAREAYSPGVYLDINNLF